MAVVPVDIQQAHANGLPCLRPATFVIRYGSLCLGHSAWTIVTRMQDGSHGLCAPARVEVGFEGEDMTDLAIPMNSSTRRSMLAWNITMAIVSCSIFKVARVDVEVWRVQLA